MCRFAALDFETANPDPASICQVGIAFVDCGAITEVWTQLVRPADPFDPQHVQLHGIEPAAVAAAPSFSEVYPLLLERLPSIVVTHSRFDVGALIQACRRNRLPMLDRTWLDSAKVARLAWPTRFPRHSTSLQMVSESLGITYRPHDAGEDARAAAQVVLAALDDLRLPLATVASHLGMAPRYTSRANRAK